MTDLEGTLSRHLAREARAAVPRPDLAAVTSETRLVSLRAVAPIGTSRRRHFAAALAVAAVVAVSVPAMWRAGDMVGGAPFAGAHHRTSCRVFMRPEASVDEILRVGNTLRPRTDVQHLELVTQQEAFEEFRQLFAHKPDIVDLASPSVLPAQWMFDLVLIDPVALLVLTQQLERDPSVMHANCEER